MPHIVPSACTQSRNTGSAPSDFGTVSVQGNTNRKESEMQTQASGQFKYRDRSAGNATRMFRAAFFLALLAWAPFSIGNGNLNSGTGNSPSVPTQADSARNEASRPVDARTFGPSSPTCAQLGVIGETHQIEKPLENGDLVGCGVGSNIARGALSGREERGHMQHRLCAARVRCADSVRSC